MSNTNLTKAKREKNDEFYTQYGDIQKEINAYIEYNPDVFRDKTLLLPCDDPEWSNFTKFFASNFERYGIKKLISTSYAYDSKRVKGEHKVSLFEEESPQYDLSKTFSHGKIFILEKDKDESGKINVDDLEWNYLEGDGDFRSEEVTKLRDEADIIITNPPFSLFRQFLKWIMDGGKKFLILGNQNNVNYKEVFPLIKENSIWCGVSYGAFNFKLGNKAITYRKNLSTKGEDVYASFGNICWFTNLEHGRKHKPLRLMTMEDNIKFSKHKEIRENGYQKYDNYDAIEVPYVNAIPSDYDGVMGVPISFLNSYCPEQFEILGSTQRGCHDEVIDTKKYDGFLEITQKGKRTGATGNKMNENANIKGNDGIHNYFINQDGYIVQSLYSRIFIRRKIQ